MLKQKHSDKFNTGEIDMLKKIFGNDPEKQSKLQEQQLDVVRNIDFSKVKFIGVKKLLTETMQKPDIDDSVVLRKRSALVTKPSLPEPSGFLKVKNSFKTPQDNIDLHGAHENQISALLFLSNGTLVSASKYTIKFWGPNGSCINTITEMEIKNSDPPNTVKSLAELSDGMLVIDHQCYIKYYDLKYNSQFDIFKDYISDVSRTFFSSDKLLVSGNWSNCIMIYDLMQKNRKKYGETRIATIESGDEGYSAAMRILPNGLLVSSCTDDCDIKYWNINTKSCVMVGAGHTSYARVFLCLSNGTLVSGSKTEIIWWNISSGKLLKLIKTPAIAFAELPDGTLVSGTENEIKFWNLQKGACLKTLKLPGHALAVSEDGRVAFTNTQGGIHIYNAEKLLEMELSMPTALDPSIVKQPTIIETNQPPRKQQNTELGRLSISFEIPYSDLELGKELGRGGFGVVYKARYQFEDVAVKQLHTKEFTPKTLKEFQNEMQIMANLRCSNVVQLYGVCTQQAPYCMVMQFMAGGSLYQVLHSQQPIEWKRRIKISTGIATGVAYLHRHQIVHRDLKSLNVLLDEHYRAKLTDFGLSEVKTETASQSKKINSAGTLAWMAPELFDRDTDEASSKLEKYEKYKMTDIYSLGIVLWEITTRKLPFADAHGNEALVALWAMQESKHDKIPEDKEMPPKWAELIIWCRKVNPKERPSAAQAVEALLKHQGFFSQSSSTKNPNLNVTPAPNYRGNLESLPPSGPSYYGNFSSRN